ncbi:MAG: MFS transporter [Chloroflexota bacterium]|nr:MFS transporter [Chloroflexota bacterium]
MLIRAGVERARLLVGISVFWLALSLLFDGLTVLVLPATVAGLVPQEEHATVVGAVTFVGLFAAMLVQPLAGAASDALRGRLGRRGFLALAVVGILCGLLLFGAGVTLALVALSYVILQVAGSSAQAAQQAFIPDLVDREWRGRAAGVRGAMDVGGAFLGFLVLGSLLEQGGSRPALLVIAAVVSATFVITVLLARERRGFVPPPTPETQRVVVGELGGASAAARHPADATTGRSWRTARRSLLALYGFDRRRHPAFAWLVLSRFLFLLGTYAIGRFFLFFVAARLGLDPRAAALEAGALLASLTLATAVAAVPAGWAADRFGRTRLMRAGAAVSALGAASLILPGGAAQILLLGGVLSLGSAAFGSASWAATTDVVPEREAARYMAVANFGTAGAAAAAGLAGPLVDLANAMRPGAGYPLLFAGAAIAFLASIAATQRLATASGPRPGRALGRVEEELA